MGFIFGLLIGGMVAGGGHVLPPSVAAIPFRCFAAFDVSESEYRQCRRHSLQKELFESCTRSEVRNSDDSSCSFDRAVSWEMAALRDLKKALEQARERK